MNSIRLIVSILTFALCSLSLSAQSSLEDLRTSKRIVTLNQNELPKYAIQIYSTSSLPQDVSFVKDADVVYEFYAADNQIKYFYGKYNNFAEANKKLKDVRAMGFSDAFVVNLSKVKSGQSKGGLVTKGKKKIEINPNTDYVVQLGAFRYPLYISFFEKVGNVYEYRMNDKIFRYTTLPVKGSEVEAELKRVVSLGYAGAFVVEYDTYAPFRIE